MESLEELLVEYDKFFNRIINNYFKIIKDKVWLKQQAYISFMYFYELYNHLEEKDFRYILYQYFYSYMFKVSVRNIEELDSYEDKESLALLAILKMMKHTNKYPKLREISECYGLKNMVSYSIMTYAYGELDIDIPKSEFTKERELNISDDICTQDYNEYLIDKMLKNIKSNVYKDILCKRYGINGECENTFQSIASNYGCTFQSIEDKHKRALKRLDKKYEKVFSNSNN